LGVVVFFLLAIHVYNLAIKVDNLALRDHNLALPPLILAQLINNLALGIRQQENRPTKSGVTSKYPRESRLAYTQIPHQELDQPAFVPTTPVPSPIPVLFVDDPVVL